MTECELSFGSRGIAPRLFAESNTLGCKPPFLFSSTSVLESSSLSRWSQMPQSIHQGCSYRPPSFFLLLIVASGGQPPSPICQLFGFEYLGLALLVFVLGQHAFVKTLGLRVHFPALLT